MKLNHSQKALLLAALIYLSIVAVLFFFLLWNQQSVTPAQTAQPVAVSLNMFESEPQQVETQPEVEPETEQEVEPEPIEEPLPEPEPEPIPEPEPLPEPEIKPEPKPTPEPTPKKVEPKPEPQPEPKEEVQPESSAPDVPTTEEEPLPVKPEFSQRQIDNAEQRYLAELGAALGRYAQDTYPRMAQRRNWEGQVLIRFTIRADGSMTNISIIDSSGRTLLDEAALSIFTDRMKMFFKPFPAEISRPEWRHTVPIEYKLR